MSALIVVNYRSYVNGEYSVCDCIIKHDSKFKLQSVRTSLHTPSVHDLASFTGLFLMIVRPGIEAIHDYVLYSV